MKVTGRVMSGLGPLEVRPDGKATRSEKGQARSEVGQVRLSAEAIALQDALGSDGGGVREDLISEAKAMIAAGELETDANLEAALDRLMAHLL